MSRQCGNICSSNNAVVAWNMTLLGLHMKWKPLVPSVYPKKVISSALGVSLLTQTSSGIKMYAPQPITLRRDMSGLSLFFERSPPIMVMHRGSVINMNHVLNTKFPPVLWKAGSKMQCLCLLYQGPVKMLCVPTLLMHMWNAHSDHYPLLPKLVP